MYQRWSLVAAAAAVALVAACGHTPSKRAAPVDQVAPAIWPAPAGWWRDDVFYEIFVRSFADSDGDGVGDFRGLTAKLDYLNDGEPGGDDLGVDGVWLMPIHPTPSYHGYDVLDYTGVNPQYGTMADFDAFLREAHRRGIRVILDFLLNHSGSGHPWFVSASQGPDAPHRDYYTWSREPLPWARPWDGAPVWHPLGDWHYYGLFWSGMPDLNLANPEVEAAMLDAMRFWLARGVDGFRVDAARHLFESADGELTDRPESHALVKRLRRALEAEFPHVLLVAEAWTDIYTVSDYYGQGDEFQLAFGFDMAAAIKASVRDGSADAITSTLATAIDAYADPAFEAPFLSNHDMARVMRDFGGDAGKARVAAAVLHALPGTPFLYYGEELGLQGGPQPRDEDKRTPMRWNGEAPGYGFTTAASTWYGAPVAEAEGVSVAAQSQDPGSLLGWYRRLIALRHASPALATGAPARPAVTGGGRGVLAVLRTAEAQRVLFVANVSPEAAAAFTVEAEGTPRVLLADGLAGAPALEGTTVTLDGLAPFGFAFIALN